ncbi:MAG: SMC family ATPase [Candidatus Thermoplasmatota archaeon]|nr:SMC family ATPase [Candidatus Thermoplasmatota archaeon]
MRFRSIELHNIRSHQHSRIDFPDGITLIEGDVGSGKSSILMAMEFSLFASSDVEYVDLLRIGEDAGSVSLEFESGDGKYSISRSIERKGDSLKQKNMFLDHGGKTQKLSAFELKKEILRILGFREDATSRSKNWIYRAAIFSAQDAMKDVLSDNSEARLKILRRILGTDDYSRAAANARMIVSMLGNEVSRLEGITAALPERIRGIADLEEKLKDFGSRIAEAEMETEKLRNAFSSQEKVVEEIRKRRDSMAEAERELSRMEGEYRRTQFLLKDEESTIIRKTGDLRKSKEKLDRLMGLRKPEVADMETIRANLKRLGDQKSGIIAEQRSLSEKIRDYRIAVQKGVCPFCDRPVTGTDFESHLLEKESRSEDLKSKLAAVVEEIGKYEAAEREFYAYQKETAGFEELQYSVSSLERDIEELGKKKESLDSVLNAADMEIKNSRGRLGDFGKVEKDLNESDSRRKAIRLKLDDSISRSSDLKGQKSRGQEELDAMKAEVDRLKGIVKSASLLREKSSWVSTFLIPAFMEMERSILAHQRAEFEKYFTSWFSRLVSDPEISATVDESFSPLINYGQFNQEVSSLSGGEKTSVAIAYRLALNMLLQSMVGSPGDLLILDEPTDGFSSEQVSKMGEILRELKLGQIILVSHEAEMEVFADHVIRITKENSVTSVLN